jgi:hypothetical protein
MAPFFPYRCICNDALPRIKNMPELKWQNVDDKGIIQRYPIDAGWVYVVYDWKRAPHIDPKEGGYWHIVNALEPDALSALAEILMLAPQRWSLAVKVEI